jgi:leader peptidase (prepilin peptidase) / N-methyltransferase
LTDLTLLADVIRYGLILPLAYVAYVDFRTFRIPDAITFRLIAGGLLFNLFLDIRFCSPQEAILGTTIGFGFFWGLNWLYRYFKGRDGLGMGDAKLLAALGAWLGWQALPGIVLLSALSGLLGGVIWLYWQKQGRTQAFPFGPFLAFAGIIYLIWPQLLRIPLSPP